METFQSYFYKFLRSQKRFDSTKALVEQLFPMLMMLAML